MTTLPTETVLVLRTGQCDWPLGSGEPDAGQIRIFTLPMHGIRATMSMMVMDTITGFQWDDGNMGKVETRGFTVADVERAFLNGRGTYFPDLRHSEVEERYWLIGIIDDGRHVTVPFTVRTERIRPITAWTTARKYREWVR